MDPPTDLAIPEKTIREVTADAEMPAMGTVEQVWDTDPVPSDEIGEHAAIAVGDLKLEVVPEGGTIAVGVGSRGIANLARIVEEVIDELADRGYEPFIVPAMGSHGGATADGQRGVLDTLGVTEDRVDCEIRSSMDTVEIDRTSERDVPVVTDTHAADADAILPINRVKPHTDYDGDIESGLAKMLVIGFGKQRGAKIAHDWAVDWSLSAMVPSIARQLIETLPIVGGVAILEDQRDQTARIEGVPATHILERERELLEQAEELLPRLPFEDIDVLIVDRQGKDISGQGIDPNVIGRRPFAINEPKPDTPDIKRIYVRSLSERTHGNAMGIGSADFVHRDVFADINPSDTFVNAITASTIRGIRMPPVVETDRAGIRAALSSIGVNTPEHVSMVRITDTMRLERLYASPALLDAAESRDDLRVIDPATTLAFAEDGTLSDPSPDPH